MIKTVLCLAAALLPAFRAAGADASACNIAADALNQASSIRGLKRLQPVPCSVSSREEIKGHLLSTIKEELPPKKLEMEGLVYSALGLVPEDYDYKERVVDLYLSQIGGYYDPKKKSFVMADWSPAVMQNTVAVHELTHALQDQHFNLDRLIDVKSSNGDQLLARSSLIEGDATAVMLDYNFRLAGQPGLRSREDVNSLMLQSVLGASLTSSLQDAPRSLVALMIFPYTSGLRFVHALLLRGGYQSVDGAYRRLPRSTEEILHPEKYFRDKPDFILLSDEDVLKELKQRDGAKVLYADAMGEFAISALLYQGGAENSAEAAAGWGGDRVVVLGGTGAEGRTVVWKTHWDTEADAKEFEEAYRKSVASKASARKIRIERVKKHVTVFVQMPS